MPQPADKPRVVIVSLASDFGCQVELVNILNPDLHVLDQVEIAYWQLVSSGELPDAFDIAVVEGAVTSDEHVELLGRLRSTATSVVAVGACALSGGVVGLGGVVGRDDGVAPRAVADVIDVDYHVFGCPINASYFVEVLQRAIRGLSDKPPRRPLCAVCTTHDNRCFLEDGVLCLGLVTRSGCGAKCISLGHACVGCRGLAADADLHGAELAIERCGIDVDEFRHALRMFGLVREARP